MHKEKILTFFSLPPSTGSLDKLCEIERDYRDRLYAVSKDLPFTEPILKRAKIIVNSEDDIEIVVQFKVLEDLLRVLNISSIYNLPEFKFKEESFFAEGEKVRWNG